MKKNASNINQLYFDRAKKVIPSGVNSPVRAFTSVGGTPRFIRSAQSAYMWDANDERYIDYIGSWGPMILGHGHPEVVRAVQEAIRQGFSFGAPTLREIELAEAIINFFPSMEMVRLVNSGTEASMSAIRLARAATGRDKFIKFEGCYHGHADALLVKAGSGLAAMSSPTSSGVPQPVVEDTIVLEYNNCEQLNIAFNQYGSSIACLIIEPIAGNMNFVRASNAFMEHCQLLCKKYGALLIFDEVMTGLRVGRTSAQGLYAKTISGFSPDLTILGKIIGGGMPLAAFGGRKDVMNLLAPLGGVYQAGTLSGNPIATACGLATLKEIAKDDFYENLAQKTEYLMTGLKLAALEAKIPFSTDYEGGMFGFFLLEQLPKNYTSVMLNNKEIFSQFFHAMLNQGSYFAPAHYEAGFVSSAHSYEDLDETIDSAHAIFLRLKTQASFDYTN
jgi:glutamate-1-semialdehyde 2,1-aminomutase